MTLLGRGSDERSKCNEKRKKKINKHRPRALVLTMHPFVRKVELCCIRIVSLQCTTQTTTNIQIHYLLSRHKSFFLFFFIVFSLPRVCNSFLGFLAFLVRQRPIVLSALSGIRNCFRCVVCSTFALQCEFVMPSFCASDADAQLRTTTTTLNARNMPLPRQQTR